MQNGLFAAKSHLNKRIDEMRDEIESAFAMCSNDVLEVKLTERMNEAIQLLTRQSADRIETKKTLRILEKQIKNVFDVTTFILSNQQTGMPVPPSLLQEVGKHGLLHSTNALASHIQSMNKLAQMSQNESDA